MKRVWKSICIFVGKMMVVRSCCYEAVQFVTLQRHTVKPKSKATSKP